VTSVPGGVQTWPLVGSFDLDGTDSFPIFWNPGSGQFSTDALIGNDSRGIVVSTGDLLGAVYPNPFNPFVTIV
jgi:hypothetical protein